MLTKFAPHTYTQFTHFYSSACLLDSSDDLVAYNKS